MSMWYNGRQLKYENQQRLLYGMVYSIQKNTVIPVYKMHPLFWPYK